MCCFPGLFHFVERIRGGRCRAGNGASLALLVFMRGLLNTLRANLHDPMLVPVDQMLMHGMDSKDIRTRFRTYGFSVLMRVASLRSTCPTRARCIPRSRDQKRATDQPRNEPYTACDYTHGFICVFFRAFAR